MKRSNDQLKFYYDSIDVKHMKRWTFWKGYGLGLLSMFVVLYILGAYVLA